MTAWKQSGARLMAYLQPMIVWGTPPKDDLEAQKVFAMHTAANTQQVFQKPLAVRPFGDQHHLGDPAWQSWFLNWVKSYIQDYGADDIYHDQSYPAPVDGRGLINGMTPPQGMADYFYRAATQSPSSIQGTEHLQECNSVGASLGIGSGILWGVAPDMRKQRLLHPSCVSNALDYPNATIFGFPHFSDFGMHGDLPGLALQNTSFYSGKTAPYDQWVNEVKLDRERSLLFVHYGLRPTYPDDRSRDTLSYFRGANGEDFRYEKTTWGSRFVQRVNDQPQVVYARAHGDMHAPGDKNQGGNVAGWIFYNDNGPSGFHPDRYYVLDPALSRPAVYFSPAFQELPGGPYHESFYEHYVDDGGANGNLAFLVIKPIPSVGNIIRFDKIFLHAPDAPEKVWINGSEFTPQISEVNGQKLYLINFESPATICVLLKQPQEGFGNAQAMASAALVRAVSSVNLDVFDSTWLSSQLQAGKVKLPGNDMEVSSLTLHAPPFLGVQSQQIHLPLKAPILGATGAASKGEILKLHLNLNRVPLQRWSINGTDQDDRSNPLLVPFMAGENKVISLTCSRSFSVAMEWCETP